MTEPDAGQEMRRHRVCFVAPGHVADTAGPSRQVAEASRALAGLGHDVHVIGRGDFATGSERVDGVWRHTVTVSDRWLPGLKRFAARDDLYAAVAKHRVVLALHREQPFDLVTVALMHGEGLLCALDPRLPTVTRVMTTSRHVGDLETWLGADEQTAGRVALERETLAHSRYVHAATRAIARDVAPPSASSLCIEPLGTRDRGATAPPPGRSGLAVLFVGRLERRKGVDVLLEAIRRLVAAGVDIRLTLVGPEMARDERGETYPTAFARGAPGGSELARRVCFAGRLADEELWRHYADADVVCMPSRYESFGNVLIEAMMSGRPVVASDAGGIAEVVEHEADGLLVTPGDVGSLASALGRLADDRALLERLGRHARQSYMKRFDVADTAPRTLAACLAMVARDAPAADGGDADRLLTERLTGALSRVLGPEAAPARELARQLQEGAAFTVDHAGRLVALWYEPAEAFVDGAFRALLGRPPHPGERGAWLAQLKSGTRRRDLVLEILRSSEATRRGMSPDWIPDLMARLTAGRPAQLARARDAPDDEFLRVSYLAVVGREAGPDAPELVAALDDRDRVVRMLVDSDEAAAYATDGVAAEL